MILIIVTKLPLGQAIATSCLDQIGSDFFFWRQEERKVEVKNRRVFCPTD